MIDKPFFDEQLLTEPDLNKKHPNNNEQFIAYCFSTRPIFFGCFHNGFQFTYSHADQYTENS